MVQKELESLDDKTKTTLIEKLLGTISHLTRLSKKDILRMELYKIKKISEKG